MEPFLHLTTDAEDAAGEAAASAAGAVPVYLTYLMGSEPGPRRPWFRMRLAYNRAVAEYRAAHPLTASEIEGLWFRWYEMNLLPRGVNPHAERMRVRQLAPWAVWRPMEADKKED